MTALAWIVFTGVAMSAIALVGSATLLMKKATLDRLVMPLVAFAAGSLLGGSPLRQHRGIGGTAHPSTEAPV